MAHRTTRIETSFSPLIVLFAATVSLILAAALVGSSPATGAAGAARAEPGSDRGGRAATSAGQPTQAVAFAQTTPDPGDLTLDQTTCTSPVSGVANVRGNTWKAQTFVPGAGGLLGRVELVLQGFDSSTTTLHIRATDAAGAPVGEDLAAATGVDGRFVFEQGVPLQADQLYALVLSGDQGTNAGWAYSDRADCYANPRGQPFTSMNGGQAWSADLVDFFFTTYMDFGSGSGTPRATRTPTLAPTVPATPEPVGTPRDFDGPASCPAAGGAQTAAVGGLTWKAQTFVPARSGWLLGATLPGLNEGGSTTLHLRLAECAGVPGADDLATTAITQGNRFAFEAPPYLVAGEQYALALSHPDGPGAYHWRYSQSAECYREGGPFTSTNGGRTWSNDIVDFHFQTTMRAYLGAGTALPPLPTPAPTLGHTNDPNRSRRTVMVITVPTGNDDPAHVLRLSQDLADLLRKASTYHGYAGGDTPPPALDFAIYQNRVFRETTMPPRCGGTYDLAPVYAKYGICDLVARGEVDEVWFWDGGLGGFPEWATNGPEWSSLQGTNMPNCGRQSALMVLHNGLDLGYALHSYGHRMETTFMNYFRCDVTTRTWPWTDWGGVCGARASDRTGFVARSFAGNDEVAACGDIHYPPNIVAGESDYIYHSRRTVKSICPDWRRDGQAKASDVSCATWGCTQQGYMVWWMQNVPGPRNINRDAAGQPYPNWWPYLFGRASAPTPEPTTPAATPTDTPPPITATVATPTPTQAPPTTTPVPRPLYLPFCLVP